MDRLADLVVSKLLASPFGADAERWLSARIR